MSRKPNPCGIAPLADEPEPSREGWALAQGVWLDERHVQNRVGVRNGSLTVIGQRRVGPANVRKTVLTFQCDCGGKPFDGPWLTARVRCPPCSRKKSSATMGRGLRQEERRESIEARRRRVRSAMWREKNLPKASLDHPLRPPTPPRLGDFDE